MPSKEIITKRFLEIQDSICLGLENLDGKSKFIEDNWIRPEGGGGRSRVITHGNLLEKGGVNFSAVEGECPAFFKKRNWFRSKNIFRHGSIDCIAPYFSKGSHYTYEYSLFRNR